MQFWEWDEKYVDRFNPMDDATSYIPHIAILQAINSMREFVTGKTGGKIMDNNEFAEILEVALSIAMKHDD